jgi:hypothetical protein
MHERSDVDFRVGVLSARHFPHPTTLRASTSPQGGGEKRGSRFVTPRVAMVAWVGGVCCCAEFRFQ